MTFDGGPGITLSDDDVTAVVVVASGVCVGYKKPTRYYEVWLNGLTEITQLVNQMMWHRLHIRTIEIFV